MADDSLRLSMEAKATVTVGPCARGGKTRVPVQAADHDCQPLATVTPVGLFLPRLAELFVYGVSATVTRDCLVERLAQGWESVRERFTRITTLVINLDNGPENHSRRTQFMQRMVDFVQQYRLTVRLAYYPPYPSKYTPLARCWGILENHWKGTLLDSIDTVLQFARTLTWKGKPPVVEVVTTTYSDGRQIDPGRDGDGRSPNQAAARAGKMVCGHRASCTGCAGYIIIFESLITLYTVRKKGSEEKDGTWFREEDLLKQLPAALRAWRTFCQDPQNHFWFRQGGEFGSPEEEVWKIIHGEDEGRRKPHPFFLEDQRGQEVLRRRFISEWLLNDRYDWLKAFRLCCYYWEVRPKPVSVVLGVLLIALVSLLGAGCFRAFQGALLSLAAVAIYISFRTESFIELLVPRLWAAVVVGYVPMLVTGAIWEASIIIFWRGVVVFGFCPSDYLGFTCGGRSETD